MKMTMVVVMARMLCRSGQVRCTIYLSIGCIRSLNLMNDTLHSFIHTRTLVCHHGKRLNMDAHMTDTAATTT
eukprot:COSAG06_NODE_156_length_21863_cov_29.245405_20_plen_72_part_00